MVGDVDDFCQPPGVDFRNTLVGYLKKIFVPQDEGLYWNGSIGTGGDYDMTLVGLANMLYLLTHDEALLGDTTMLSDAAYGILCQNGKGPNTGCEFSGAPSDRPESEWDGMNAFLAFGLEHSYFESENGTWATVRPETENHVLSIYAWNYLASMWILRMGLDPGQGMREEIQAWAIEGLGWLEEPGNAEKFFSPILQALGRVVHNGYFETNARPYQELSLFAILTLAVYGDIFADRPPGDHVQIPEEIRDYARRVRQAARNAMHYTAATFAFQSMRGKRSAPMRRRHDYKEVADFYGGNRTAFLFGLLSGAHEYDDCTEENNASCDLFRSPKLNHRHRLLWTALMRLSARKSTSPQRRGYELPSVIQGHFFDQRRYFGILQARATLGQYSRTGEPPGYFEPSDPTQTLLPGRWRGHPELYFGTGDLMLAAGGTYNVYYDPEHLPWEDADPQYRFWSRASMLFARGDFGHPYDSDDPMEWQWADLRDGSDKDVLVMRGRRDKWWQSDCNVWTYKSFAYGYNYDPTVEPSWAEGWAQDYPGWWTYHPNQAFSIEEARFRLFYFAPDVLGPGVGAGSDGYYVILGRLRKEGADDPFKWWHYNYQRGIVEVVPGDRFPHLD
ncbi:MAG: hypothetical protein RBU30_27400, partial [Polyangia bacterium]|nr:hypothetical protein [Polyangia bacterium]